jgi:tRNA(Ile)-lysidine synthase TilS/MesJ
MSLSADLKRKNPRLYLKVKSKINGAINDFSMFNRSDRIAVALSGGKDSVTLLLILKELNYNVEAFFIDLGIKNFTPKSLAYVNYICDEFNIKFNVLKASDFAGFTVDETTGTYPGMQCGICGTVKRQMFNRFAAENGFDVLAVGHNMDDEAQMLLANNIKWDMDYLKKSFPVLDAKPGFVKRVKPLCYLREPDIKKFIKETGIEVLHCQCPHSAHGSRKKYSKILFFAASLFPGFIESYYLNFLKNHQKLKHVPTTEPVLSSCKSCGELSSSDLCRLCAIKQNLWRK